MAADFFRPDHALRDRLQASRLHWESQGADGAPLVMPGADLRRVDLREQVLVGAQLQGADLSGSLLDSALLMRAALDGARLAGAHLFSTDASKATLVRAELAGIQAPRSIWRRSSLTQADATAARLDDSDFTGAELIGVRLDRASLLRADFTNAVLLRASFIGTDLTTAVLRGAAIDPQGLRGLTESVFGDAATAFGSTPRRREIAEREFVDTMQRFLAQREIRAHGSLQPGPDFVVELPGEWFAAVEASVSRTPDRLSRLAEQADLIVVPDDLETRRAINGTPVARLREIEVAIDELQPSRLKPYGASALAIREADRLRPYVTLADQARVDPRFISRVSGILDTRNRDSLSSADREIAARLPAHLSGEMAARGASFALEHTDELHELLARTAAIRQGGKIETPEASMLARSGLRLERELAAYVSPDSQGPEA